MVTLIDSFSISIGPYIDSAAAKSVINHHRLNHGIHPLVLLLYFLETLLFRSKFPISEAVNHPNTHLDLS